jgi:hypothetical protein
MSVNLLFQSLTEPAGIVVQAKAVEAERKRQEAEQKRQAAAEKRVSLSSDGDGTGPRLRAVFRRGLIFCEASELAALRTWFSELLKRKVFGTELSMRADLQARHKLCHDLPF